MSETSELPVEDDELLARFVPFSGWIRPSNQTVKPDAFMPPENLELSVIRHVGLSIQELWQIGQSIVAARPAKLHGRADIGAGDVRKQSLDVVPTSQPRNHAHITGWPREKSAQKIIAQELAASATFIGR